MRVLRSFLLLLLAFGLVPGATYLDAQDIQVTATAQVLAGSGRVSWGSANNLLAYDQANGAGFYDVYTSNPDGSNPICLTCDALQFAYNKGNPEWQPANQFLAIEIQWAAAGLDATLESPGAGVNNDLYIMDAAGKNFWPVTQNAKGVLHPRFSHSGNQLLWVQRTFANNWNLMLGDFTVVNNVPQVTNIQSLPPCANDVFCETGSFSADDSTVFFTHSTAAASSTAFDIYSYNLTTQATLNLTNSVTQWNEFPTAFPPSFTNNSRLLWMSGIYTAEGLETDYWTMNYDGTDKTQVTFYNNSSAPDWYLGAVSTAKFSWGPGAAQLGAYLVPHGTANGITGNIYVLNLAPGAPTLSAASYSRPPVAADSIASTFFPNLATGSGFAASTALPLQLAGTTVSVTDAQNAVRPAPLFFVSQNQVNWEIPAGTAPGPAVVQFTNGAGLVSAATIDVEPASPGLFTASATGSGPAAAYVLTYPAGSSQFVFGCVNGTPCTASPVSLGSLTDSAYLVLFGTGVRHASTVTVSLQGQTLPVSFAGSQGGFPGLDQINVLLPNNLAGSGLVTLNVVADGVPSNAVQLFIQ